MIRVQCILFFSRMKHDQYQQSTQYHNDFVVVAFVISAKLWWNSKWSYCGRDVHKYQGNNPNDMLLTEALFACFG